MDSSWVAIIDDDDAAERSLELMLRGAGLATRTFTSAHEFLTQPQASAPACVVAKLLTAEMSGLELQRQLATRDSSVGVVFIAAGDDVASTVRVMKAGAVSCLQSPAEPDFLLAVREAIAKAAALRAERAARREVADLFGTLTAREREVLALVVAGLANKQIAFRLSTAEKTVKAHRWRLMRKLRVKRSIDLVRLAVSALPAGAPLELFKIRLQDQAAGHNRDTSVPASSPKGRCPRQIDSLISAPKQHVGNRVFVANAAGRGPDRRSRP